MITETDKILVRLSAYIAVLEQGLKEAQEKNQQLQTELAELKAAK